MTAALRVLAPGLMTTLQDLGRPGYQRLGVPVSGALDHVSLRAANLLVGNAADAGALEIAYQGPTLRVEAESVRIAVAGGRAPTDILPADSDGSAGRRLAAFESARLLRGEVLRIGALAGSAIAYLAVEGGFDIAPVLGSQSTLIRAAIGGLEGRALRAGDVLPLRQGTAAARHEMMLPPIDLRPPGRVRIVLGPQDDHFTPAGLRTLLESTYTISQASDRMGMRLEGPLLEHSSKGYNIVSDGTAHGSIQVPGNGLPIVLLADRQTTGGYPKIATVISADLPALGRLIPGARIAFEAVDIEAAEAAARQLAADIAGLAARLAPVRHEAAIDAMRLMGENLVSGVVNAGEGERRLILPVLRLDLDALIRQGTNPTTGRHMATRARTPLDRADADSRVPRYLQVASVLRRRIRDGHWPVGSKIATLEELEGEFGVARVTVRQAIDLLQGEGLVKSFQGRGTFVTKAPEKDRWIQLATDWESLIAPIRDSIPHFLPAGDDPPPRIEEGDDIPASAYVYLRSIQKQAGKPYAFARVHVAEHVHARAPKAFASRAALAVLSEMADLEISRAHQTLAIGAADMETARNLGIALNAPTAEARCVVTDATGTVIYVGEITYPGDCVRLNIELIGEGRA